MDWDATNLPEALWNFYLQVDLMFSRPLKKTFTTRACSQRMNVRSYQLIITTIQGMLSQKTMLFLHSINSMRKYGEPFEQFVTDLRLLLKDSNYANCKSHEIEQAQLKTFCIGTAVSRQYMLSVDKHPKQPIGNHATTKETMVQLKWMTKNTMQCVSTLETKRTQQKRTVQLKESSVKYAISIYHFANVVLSK